MVLNLLHPENEAEDPALPGLQNQHRMIKIRQTHFANRDQIAFGTKRLHVFRISPFDKRRQPEILAMADLAGGERIHGRVWNLRQHLRGWNQRLVQDSPTLELLERF